MYARKKTRKIVGCFVTLKAETELALFQLGNPSIIHGSVDSFIIEAQGCCTKQRKTNTKVKCGNTKVLFQGQKQKTTAPEQGHFEKFNRQRLRYRCPSYLRVPSATSRHGSSRQLAGMQPIPAVLLIKLEQRGFIICRTMFVGLLGSKKDDVVHIYHQQRFFLYKCQSCLKSNSLGRKDTTR